MLMTLLIIWRSALSCPDDLDGFVQWAAGNLVFYLSFSVISVHSVFHDVRQTDRSEDQSICLVSVYGVYVKLLLSVANSQSLAE